MQPNEQRGTQEQHRPVIVEAAEFVPLDYGSVKWQARNRKADRLEAVMLSIAADQQLGKEVTLPYQVLLRYMWEWEYRGACHSTSAILFVLLSESGLQPKLCIGEVGAGGPYFDHSWIELDGKVFDVAVSLPDTRGAQVGGPVFASVDLDTGIATSLDFAFYRDGLGADALVPFNKTLNEYAQAQHAEPGAGPDIWHRIVYLAPLVGLTCTVPDLIAKYGAVRREYRRSSTTKKVNVSRSRGGINGLTKSTLSDCGASGATGLLSGLLRRI